MFVDKLLEGGDLGLTSIIELIRSSALTCQWGTLGKLAVR